jgi:hypothetical protein
MGIPAVGIMTDRFQRSAELMADLNGLPGYPFAVIGHPVANNTDEVLREKAQVAVRSIVALLTTGRDS